MSRVSLVTGPANRSQAPSVVQASTRSMSCVS